MHVRVVLSASVRAHVNLALEEHIFDCLSELPRAATLMIYRNTPSVIIGKFQNPWQECAVRRMRADGIVLGRRFSGGGTVYHDLGNTNISFMTTKDDYNQNADNDIIMKSLNQAGVLSGIALNARGDILLNDRKISGSAYKATRFAKLHHRTLLLTTADISNTIFRYLNPPQRRIEATGVRSKVVPVANLKSVAPDISHELVCDAISREFCQRFQISPETEIWTEAQCLANPLVAANIAKHESWEWQFGQCPPFTVNFEGFFEFGPVTLVTSVRNAVVESCAALTGDHNPLINKLQITLVGKRYWEQDIVQAVQEAYAQCNPSEVHAELCEQIEEWMISNL